MIDRPEDSPGPACRSCGSRGVVWRGRKQGEFIQRTFEYWHCPSCDYTFVDPFPGYGVYDQAYYQGKGADPYVDYEAEYSDVRKTSRLLELDDLWRIATAYIVRNLEPGPIEWLDFGAGPGGLLRYLVERGEHKAGGCRWKMNVSMHDIGYYADRLRDEGRFRVLDRVELQREPRNRYHVISMIEVIEHLQYPDLVAAQVAKLLKPGGLLLLTTGNMASPVARLRGLSYAYCVPEIHVGLFTPRALDHLYRRHGLEPILFRYRGSIRFKVIKTLRTPGKQRLARALMRLPLMVRLIDGLYGTSRMPSAFRRP